MRTTTTEDEVDERLVGESAVSSLLVLFLASSIRFHSISFRSIILLEAQQLKLLHQLRPLENSIKTNWITWAKGFQLALSIQLSTRLFRRQVYAILMLLFLSCFPTNHLTRWMKLVDNSSTCCCSLGGLISCQRLSLASIRLKSGRKRVQI